MIEHDVPFSQSPSEYLKDENILNTNAIIGAITPSSTEKRRSSDEVRFSGRFVDDNFN